QRGLKAGPRILRASRQQDRKYKRGGLRHSLSTEYSGFYSSKPPRAIIAAMEITWLGHGTFQFVLPHGETLLFDPWTNGNPAYPKDFGITRCDTMLISHGHFDHIHDAVALAKMFHPTVVAIYETCHWLEKKGVENCSPMNKGGTQQAGSVDVTMTHAIHSCGISEDDGSIVYGGEAAGYVLTFADGRVVYFAGDTNVFTDMELIAEHIRIA